MVMTTSDGEGQAVAPALPARGGAMKVRMKTQISGTRNGGDWPPAGGEIEVSGEEGAQLCALGLAEPVTADAEPETATAPDTAEKRGRGRPRKQTPGGE